jgi:DNA helicase-2/ATP-dependent DNA helicase PcrA
MSPLIRWLQDCAQWCSGGWQQSKPPLAKLIQAWRSFNYSLKRPVELRDAQRKLVSCLFGHRDPEMSFRRWLGDLRSDVLDPVFASEGSLREESLNVSKLYELTEVGGEMEMSTVATFSGKGGSRKHLNLITFHSAKSLEFDVVFLLGVDEGRIPSWADNTPEKLAEARRRFYVGITRAKREVHLTYSGFNVNQWGRRFDSGPSRFLIELQNRMKG